MTGKQWTYSLIAGLGSGIVLGTVLYILEKISGKKVYTLLMNVDFIPLLNNYLLPGWVEFSLHVMVSLLLSVCIQYMIVKKQIRCILCVTCAAVFPTIFLYFPLSMLAVKEVAHIHDIVAFSYWTLGHIVYALLLGYMLSYANKVTR